MAVVRVDPVRPDPEDLARAAAVLRRGGLVAFPTETVYGLGANALSAEAVRRIFEVKGRPPSNPLIVHVADVEAAKRLVAAWPPEAEALARVHWPGPLTLVLPRKPEVPDIVTAGLDTVAVRVPAHPVALALIRAADLPIAAPSANVASRISPTTALHVEKAFGDRVELILDGGPTDVGIESTVVDLSGAEPVLLRPGVLGAEQLERDLGGIPLARTARTERPRSPGQLTRHYAPRAELLLFEGPTTADAVAAARRAADAGRRVGGLLLRPLEAPFTRVVLMPDAPATYARRLYAALHELDDAGCDLILAEAVPEEPGWAAVRDRLHRAASGGPLLDGC